MHQAFSNLSYSSMTLAEEKENRSKTAQLQVALIVLLTRKHFYIHQTEKARSFGSISYLGFKVSHDY